MVAEGAGRGAGVSPSGGKLVFASGGASDRAAALCWSNECVTLPIAIEPSPVMRPGCGALLTVTVNDPCAVFP